MYYNPYSELDKIFDLKEILIKENSVVYFPKYHKKKKKTGKNRKKQGKTGKNREKQE
jgi:hypothetical protein